jgi:hypothetical protein
MDFEYDSSSFIDKSQDINQFLIAGPDKTNPTFNFMWADGIGTVSDVHSFVTQHSATTITEEHFTHGIRLYDEIFLETCPSDKGAINTEFFIDDVTLSATQGSIGRAHFSSTNGGDNTLSVLQDSNYDNETELRSKRY